MASRSSDGAGRGASPRNEDRRRALLGLSGLTLGTALLAACAEVPVRAPVAREPLVFPPAPEEPRFYFERAIYSDADVVPEAQASEFRRALTGEVRRGAGLAKPYGVAVWRGRIFVSDTVQRAVRVFDVPGQRVYMVGDEEGSGSLQKPIGLDVDAAGNLYVADISLNSVMVYDAQGKFLRRIGGGKWFERLTSVTVDPLGQRVYGVDIGGVDSRQHTVRMFDAVSGSHLADIGSRGQGPGQFNLPRDLAIGKDGRLYVVDGGNFRVVMFDRDGRYLATFGSVGRQLGQFARPKEIAVDREGNVYVVDSAFGNFQIFDADGQLLMFVGSRSEVDGPARYMLPSGIAVDEDGRVYVVDQWFRKLEIYRPAKLAPGQGYLAARLQAAAAAKR